APLLLLALLRCRLAFETTVHRVDRRGQSRRVLAFAKSRRDHVANDLTRDDVGNGPFEPVADLEPELPVLREDDQDDAVAQLLLPDAPFLRELDRHVLEAFALERGKDRDRHLRA